MDLMELLGQRFACRCGRAHEVPIRRFVYGSDALAQLPEIARGSIDAGPLGHAAVVADARTWAACGERACATLQRAGIEAGSVRVPDGPHGGPICDETTCKGLIEQLRRVRPDIIVAVGSGVINDLCKWASCQLGLPYLVVATAASMNGYAAANVAAKIAGVKVLIEAKPPRAVLAEPAVIEQAPREMTTAGFGDTIAKYQSNADWVMNHLLFEEYYCPFCAGMVAGLEPLYLDHPEDLRRGDSRSVQGLFEALFWTGVAMTLVGTSAPASGGEHLLSHTLDMMTDLQRRPHDLHGRQVGLGTVVSAALYEKILAIETPTLTSLPPTIDATCWTDPDVARAVNAQYEAKRPKMAIAARKIADGPTWQRLKTRLAGEVKSAQVVHDWLKRAGGAVSFADLGYSSEDVRWALLHMHEIRARFTVVDLAWLTGVLPDALDAIIDRWLAP